jgi:hypothetical protein
VIAARRTLVALSLSLAMVACSNGDDGRSDATRPVVPNLTGYYTLALASTGPSHASAAPSGTFSYLVVDGALDWYIIARHFSPGRVYRVLLTTADGNEYAVESERSAADGSFAAHGVETVLMNRQCVGSEDPSRRPLASARTLRVAVKRDGSARGASGNDVLGSRASLPCGGNGDGVFDYVLRSADSVSMGR